MAAINKLTIAMLANVRMVKPRTFLFLFALVTTLSLGCAQGYHAYDGCYVDCKYCPPAPLPYTHFYGCVCHSCAAGKYAQQGPVAEPAANDDAADDGAARR